MRYALNPQVEAFVTRIADFFPADCLFSINDQFACPRTSAMGTQELGGIEEQVIHALFKNRRARVAGLRSHSITLIKIACLSISI
jgi:hypothetical protein